MLSWFDDLVVQSAVRRFGILSSALTLGQLTAVALRIRGDDRPEKDQSCVSTLFASHRHLAPRTPRNSLEHATSYLTPQSLLRRIVVLASRRNFHGLVAGVRQDPHHHTVMPAALRALQARIHPPRTTVRASPADLEVAPLRGP